MKPRSRPADAARTGTAEVVSADVALLDVNVLLALFDPMHLHHALIRHWFAARAARRCAPRFLARCAEFGGRWICAAPVSESQENTDRYLLRLAMHQGGCLLTMDTGIVPADDAERATLSLLVA